jgi:hypothetical protein
MGIAEHQHDRILIHAHTPYDVPRNSDPGAHAISDQQSAERPRLERERMTGVAIVQDDPTPNGVELNVFNKSGGQADRLSHAPGACKHRHYRLGVECDFPTVADWHWSNPFVLPTRYRRFDLTKHEAEWRLTRLAYHLTVTPGFVPSSM